ncbi:MAG: Eco47II family restriction endonuclease [Pseudomonadota bacterium]|nr:Eco47II family restriction endonuclease [Pseudomonadota bacterium]
MRVYGLGFLTDTQLFEHVKATVEKYRSLIDLAAFNKNIIDPIKLTFDSKIYQKSIAETIEIEIVRQLDKSNNNHIGYFHQNIFRYFDGWDVPTTGYDVVNSTRQIYVEMKNKHNTMNSSSSQKTYMRMQNTVLSNPQAQCLLVEVIAKKSQNLPWNASLDGKNVSHPNIRRVSIDQFYHIVTGDALAFRRLCEVLPLVIEDVIAAIQIDHLIQNSVIDELNIQGSDDLLKTIYLTSFGRYQGFDQFGWGAIVE